MVWGLLAAMGRTDRATPPELRETGRSMREHKIRNMEEFAALEGISLASGSGSPRIAFGTALRVSTALALGVFTTAAMAQGTTIPISSVNNGGMIRMQGYTAPFTEQTAAVARISTLLATMLAVSIAMSPAPMVVLAFELRI